MTWGSGATTGLGKSVLDYRASGATIHSSTKGRWAWPLAAAPKQEDVHGDVCWQTGAFNYTHPFCYWFPFGCVKDRFFFSYVCQFRSNPPNSPASADKCMGAEPHHVRLGFLFAWQNFFMTYEFLNKKQGEAANHLGSDNGRGKKIPLKQ